MKNRKAVESMIKNWDEGHTIQTLDMSGMGPGYEQAIQVTVVEFLRAALQKRSDIPKDGWEKHCNGVLKKIDDAVGGLSGAQFSAAAQLASIFYYRGGEDGLNDLAREQKQTDRLILASKMWLDADKAKSVNT